MWLTEVSFPRTVQEVPSRLPVGPTTSQKTIKQQTKAEVLTGSPSSRTSALLHYSMTVTAVAFKNLSTGRVTRRWWQTWPANCWNALPSPLKWLRTPVLVPKVPTICRLFNALLTRSTRHFYRRRFLNDPCPNPPLIAFTIHLVKGSRTKIKSASR